MAGRFVLFLLASAITAVQAQGNSACAHWCKDNFPNPGADCTSLAAKRLGPCYECGPLKTVPSKQLCAGSCADTLTDNANCGSCGNACGSEAVCTNGVCKPLVTPCDTPFRCGYDIPRCGGGGPGTYCVCFPRPGHPNGANACIDAWAAGCGQQCSSDADCPSAELCFSSCCGQTCIRRIAICPAPASPSRLFRRGTFDDIAATSPLLNATVAQQQQQQQHQ
ncbi:hypothetical protein QBC42DRAFT_253461 [Cladorrhinum samala]|uniref:Uncharacterized protein n=1 Tax=Cladorrhinum samala TaxID=585594 RepID=A0AAV9HHQ4_9PEZI|nr:hypothetical protein QBC42DRAFT_253461 [Cladorrhinum samala]